MPTCRRCDAEFPLHLEVDGKMRNLQRRKFCLGCSPFGFRNTRPELKQPRTSKGESRPLRYQDAPIITCAVCGRQRGGRGRRCFTCLTRLRKYRAQCKAVALLGGKCMHCGWSGNIAALQFHHRDPAEKHFEIGRSLHKGWNFVAAELAKCDLLCANCHVIEHTRRDERFLQEAEMFVQRTKRPGS